MDEHDDFARDLRAMAHETLPVRHVAGAEALARVKRRHRARGVRVAAGLSACVALAAVGAVSVLPRLDVQQAVASPVAESATAGPSVAPYTGGPITEDHYKEIVEHAATCLRDKGYPAGPVEKRIDGVSYGFEIDYPAGMVYRDSMTDLLACEAEVNLREAEVVYTNQVRLRGVAPDKAFTQFAECMAEVDVIVTEEDTLATVTDKAAGALVADGPLGWAAMCLDSYTPRLYG
ncbi:hypothetical protein [Oerskovia turbata]